MVKKLSYIAQDTYPDSLGNMFICNAPLIFTSIFTMIKSWLDERTRKKIFVLGSNYRGQLFEFCDLDQIPDFLGGTNRNSFTSNLGPWNDYQLVDSTRPGAEIGVRRIGDPNGKVFGPKDVMKL